MRRERPMTDVVRRVALALLAGTVLVALGGWLLGRDPGQLGDVLLWVTAALGIGEASNVGKRATTRPEMGAAGANGGGDATP